MKKLLLLLMFAMPAFAQQQIDMTKRLKCSSTEYVFKLFKEQFDEKPVWLGRDKGTDTYITLLENKEKGTWSLIQYDADLACILGAGEQGRPS